ncbi:hypothetical protein GGQ64_004357 [Rhizobium azooxidifex]|uniref:DUF4747 family protein n=1 Tax=Mycoplana azooxidifex TaxID=1636188 RepID=A0A7W6DD84_9HYPH|nr:DUF4747 family protein [Mycoplana azooxidifex]MBB3979121.1 hypothetical protein [Mycoplana azooxidifex]
MARKIKISSSILNIRLHPHSPEIYSSFIKDAYDLKRIIRLHGDRHGIISFLDRSRADRGIITGTITTFVVVEIDGDWFDTEKLSEATDTQVSQVSIPENLHPNSAQFLFHFDINRHKIYVQNYSRGKVLTPSQGLLFFNSLAQSIEMTEKYNYANITLVQSKDGLKKLFKLDRIDRITITIMKPNADILSDDFEAQIEAHLAESHAKKLSITYHAEPGESLVPTPDINTLSDAALENGDVEVAGRNDGASVRMSTSEIPRVLQDRYDPDLTTESQAFTRLVTEGADGN